MAQQWFYAKQGKQIGPVPLEQLQKAVAGGEVLPTDLVWTEGMPQWTPAGQVKALAGNAPRAAGQPVPPTPPAAAKPRPAEPAAPSPAAPAAAPGPTGSSLLGPLDLRFKHFFTPSLVKLIWLLYLIVAPLWYLINVGIIAADVVFRKAPPLLSLKGIAVDLIQFCFLTLAVRLALEAALLLLRIAEHLCDIRDKQHDRGAEHGQGSQ